MADNYSPNQGSEDSNPWGTPAKFVDPWSASTNQGSEDLSPWTAPADFVDPWSDPADLRTKQLRQLQRYRAGFALFSLGLIVASLSGVVYLVAIFLMINRIGAGVQIMSVLQSWDFVVETAVVIPTLLGAGLLWGRWPDASWRRRSGMLLLMCFGDLVLWSIDHARKLGLSDFPIGHEYFRTTLGMTVGWFEFALIASLAAGLVEVLGDARIRDFERAVRSMIIVGASLWVFNVYIRTDWNPPIWPLHETQRNLRSFMLHLGCTFLSTTVFVQVSLLCIYAGRISALSARKIKAEDLANEPFPSRSEAGWDDHFRNDRDRPV